ncbi:MAG: DNA-formamidopyrimidine glycosylase family protein, partial [Verrucomicrobiota bacterium]
MPEYPDIMLYIEALETRLVGQALQSIAVQSPFLLRTAEPPVESFEGKRVSAIRRMGKRIVIDFESSHAMVLHLMIAGRLHWKPSGKRAPGKSASLILTFETGLLYLTEAGTKKRASLHLFDQAAPLEALNPGGLDVFEEGFDA